ncbi:MAG: alpha/beta hydrolase [Limisphaerales bacterium]
MKRVIQEPEHIRKLRCEEILRESHDADTESVKFRTSDSDLIGRYHPARKKNPKAAAVWVGGAGGGLDGPARALYAAACKELQGKNVAGLRLHYRYPNHLEECVLDTLLGVEFLANEGYEHVALVGHSFGGAVVITAGAVSPRVKAVVPMSTQTYGVELAPELSPRPLLLIHGTKDEILPDRCSKYVYGIANDPKELRLFEGARHGLDEAREEILELLVTWISEQLSRAEAG